MVTLFYYCYLDTILNHFTNYYFENNLRRAYSLAETLNRQVDDMGRQLSAMIDQVNAASSSSSSSRGGGGTTPSQQGVLATDEPPVAKIVRILDTHLTSLQWLDESAEDLAARVCEVRRRAALTTEEAERVHRLRGEREREAVAFSTTNAASGTTSSSSGGGGMSGYVGAMGRSGGSFGSPFGRQVM